jgi:hypothetical protein
MDRSAEWSKGEPVKTNYVSDGIECACCIGRYLERWSKTDLEIPDIKFFADSHGFVCRSCFFKAPPCHICGGLGIVGGLCRDCYIDEKEGIKTINDLAWSRTESIFENCGPKGSPRKHPEYDQYDEEDTWSSM